MIRLVTYAVLIPEPRMRDIRTNSTMHLDGPGVPDGVEVFPATGNIPMSDAPSLSGHSRERLAGERIRA